MVWIILFLISSSNSLVPFVRHFNNSLLDKLEIVDDKSIQGKLLCSQLVYNSYKLSLKFIYILVKESELGKLFPVLKKYKDAKENNRILTVPFTTLIEYMWLLRGSCMLLDTKYSMLYLAAAVSDFYIPPNEMVCHLLRFNFDI